jgi:hypothetical protein
LQEAAIYSAMLAELSNDELASVIVAEIKRRKCFGVIYIVDGDECSGHFASVHSDTAQLSPPRRLAQFALHANELEAFEMNYTQFDPDDDITSDTKKWRQ